MATSTSFSFMFLLMLSFISGGIVTMANGEVQKTWCVAKPSTSEANLQNNIVYACTYVDCKPVIQPGNPCFYPDTTINHASVVMNLYYRFAGANVWNCNFTESALTVLTDPSYENCHYA